jgi:hypothetical protein
MGVRNQVGIGLPYRPAGQYCLATQFHTRFLELIPRPIAGLKFPTLYIDAEKKGRESTELVQSCFHTLQRTNTENWKQQFPEKELRGHNPYFHIHVSVSDLYIPTMDLPILLQEICGPILGIYK